MYYFSFTFTKNSRFTFRNSINRYGISRSIRLRNTSTNGTLFSKEIISMTELTVFQKQTYKPENSRLRGLLSFIVSCS